jgi:hypothetical protein
VCVFSKFTIWNLWNGNHRSWNHLELFPVSLSKMETDLPS